VNAGSFYTRLSPGVVAMIGGSNFGNAAQGVTVQVNGINAPVNFVTPSTISAQIPFEIAIGPASVTVQVQSARSAPANITIVPLAPSLFTSGADGLFLDSNFRPINAANPAVWEDAVTVFATGLGQTDPPLTTGATPTTPARILAAVTLIVGPAQVPVSAALASPAGVGIYQISFVVPKQVPPGSNPLLIRIDGIASNVVMLPVSSPSISSVENGASFAPRATGSAGALLTIKGRGFGSAENLAAYPATEVSGISITINGVAAPIFRVLGAFDQVDVLAPSELPEIGTVDVVFRRSGGSSPAFKLTMASSTPGMYGIVDPSRPTRRNAAAVEPGTRWLAMPGSQARAMGLPENCAELRPVDFCARPVKPDGYLEIYGTGFGKATPDGAPGAAPLPTGQVAPADGSVIYHSIQKPAVTIGDLPAELLGSFLTPGNAGLYQLNVRVPGAVPDGDDVPVRVVMPDGSSDTATIAVRR
jgi:uncharacterized protein (TIGR03437 family)